jgi:hypothetical protein
MTCYNSELPIGPPGPTGPQGPAGELPYKIYTALLTQSSTTPPTAVILENTLSGTPTFEYLGVGSYSIRLDGEFIEDKTFFIVGCGETSISNGAFIISQDLSTRPDKLTINTGTTVNTATWANGLLYKTPIEIKVYP